MKIIVDNKIPYIHEAVEQIADEVVYLPGSGFTAGDVRDADALVIRTRTRCNRELLEGSKVKFIATATIGFDHIDVDPFLFKKIHFQPFPYKRSDLTTNSLIVIRFRTNQRTV